MQKYCNSDVIKLEIILYSQLVVYEEKVEASTATYHQTMLSTIQKLQIPRKTEFLHRDPMGEQLYQSWSYSMDTDESEEDKLYAAGMYTMNCSSMEKQIFKLNSTDEIIASLTRTISASQTLSSRIVLLTVIARLSPHEPKTLLKVLKRLGINNMQIFWIFLRLVQGKRIGNVSPDFLAVPSPLHQHSVKVLDILGEAIVTLITDREAAAVDDIIQYCLRDLLAASVKGTDLEDLQTKPCSDVDVIYTPNFEVTQNLVQTITKSAAKLSWYRQALLNVVEGLVACVYSTKLYNDSKVWALDQTVKILACFTAGVSHESSHLAG